MLPFLPCFSSFYLYCTFHHKKLKIFYIRQMPFKSSVSSNHHPKHQRKSNVLSPLPNLWIPTRCVIHLFFFRKLPSKAHFYFKMENTNHSIEKVKLQRHMVTSSPIPSLYIFNALEPGLFLCIIIISAAAKHQIRKKLFIDTWLINSVGYLQLSLNLPNRLFSLMSLPILWTLLLIYPEAVNSMGLSHTVEYKWLPSITASISAAL